MGRRKLRKKYRLGIRTGVVVLCLATVSMLYVRNAWADPHAMFYTAIGQQQLFFNVLAALDQADYVETAFDREARRQSREEVDAEQPFTRETESGGRFTGETELTRDTAGESPSDPTQPGTPALLNRQVTLEGADLYTDQTVRELGAESARRNAAAELLQTLCEYGFGIEGCDNELKPGGTSEERQAEVLAMEQRRRSAVVVDPVEWQAMPFFYGVLPALSSGTDADELERFRRLMDEENNNTPYAYSSQIDFWRKQIASLPDASAQQAYFDMLVNKAINSLNPARQIRPWPFAEVVANQDGGYAYRHIIYDTDTESASDCWPVGDSPPCLSYEWGRDSGFYNTSDYIAYVDNQVMTGINELENIASNAADQVVFQQDLIEDQGVRADTSLAFRAPQILNYPSDIPPLSAIGDISWYVDNPVAARSASIYNIPNVLGQLATSQQASALTGLDKPGSVQLVKRQAEATNTQQPQCSNGTDDDGDGLVDYPQDPECYMDTDNSESQPGQQLAASDSGRQVAGALDLLFKPNENFFDREKEPTSPSANIISPILEFGARHALRVMTAGKWRPGTTAGFTCGYTCD